MKKSNTLGNQAEGKRECFPTLEYEENEYLSLSLDINTHIALAYENQVLMRGNWKTSPTPKGISGGAIIRVAGVSMSSPFISEKEVKQLLSAITIEQRREKAGVPGVLIGTRIRIHLELIHQFLPDLLET